MRKFYPVIHASHEYQAVSNIDIAVLAEADGCFLINHDIDADRLDDIYEYVRNIHPDFWIGLNYLGISNLEAVKRLPKTANGLWVDNLGIDENTAQYEQPEADELDMAMPIDKLLFGGVAFKYQKQVENVALAARYGSIYCDVTVTSGVQTGHAPNLDKIKAMKGAIGYNRLGLASGVDIENVYEYIPYVDDFLVATGISKSFYFLDEHKTKELSGKIHAYSK